MMRYRIKDIARINARVLSEGTPADFSFRYVDIGAVDGLGNIDIPAEEITFDKSPSRARRLAPAGSVIVSTVRTYLKAIASVPDGDDQLVFSTGFAVLEATGKADQRYLAYHCQSQPFVEAIVARSTGVSYPAISASEIGNLPIELPPPDEQRRIADFLDVETARIDRMCLLSKRQIAALRESLAETFRVYTTGEAGSGRATGIPWMPSVNAGWRLHKVGHHFITGSGTTPASGVGEYFDGPHPWVNSADIRDGRISRAERSVTDKALTDYSSLQVHSAGSLVVAMYGQGETKGRTGILAMDSTVNQACCVLKPIGDLRVDYLQYWFTAHKSGVVNLAVGAGQPNLSQELIRQLRVPAPDLEEQGKIADALREAEHGARHRIERLERRGRLLAERRQALITAAVTGQLDVTTARPAHDRDL